MSQAPSILTSGTNLQKHYNRYSHTSYSCGQTNTVTSNTSIWLSSFRAAHPQIFRIWLLSSPLTPYNFVLMLMFPRINTKTFIHHFPWRVVLEYRKESVPVGSSIGLKCVMLGLIYVFKRLQSHIVEILVYDLMHRTTLFCQAEEHSLLQSHIKITFTSLANAELAT